MRRARGPPLGLCPPGHQASPPVGAAALGGPWETDRPHNRDCSPHPPPSGAPSPKGEGLWVTKSRPCFCGDLLECPQGRTYVCALMIRSLRRRSGIPQSPPDGGDSPLSQGGREGQAPPLRNLRMLSYFGSGRRKLPGWAADSRPYSPPETSRGAFQEPTLIRHGFAVPPSPWRGKARATARVAPTVKIGLGALARQTQAQKRDRTKSRFCEPRAPVGPEGTAPKHS